MHFLITCFKIFMNFIYFFFKLFRTKNKITFISRQSDNANIDFKLLSEEIKRESPETKIVMLTKYMKNGLLNKVKYSFHMFTQMYHIATSKAVILDSYCIMISILKHKKTLTVVQIWHALGSLKKFGYSALDKKDGRSSNVAKNMNMHKNYTYILTSSEASKPYFQEAFNANEEQMKVMSLPRVDFLQSEDSKKEILSKFYEFYPEINNKKKNILYCPTQRKTGIIPIEEMANNIDFNKYNFIAKLHDGTEIIYIDKKSILRRESKFTGLELLHIGDYIITDYSAIVYEAAITKKPIYLYTYDYDTYVDDRGFYIDYQKEMPGPICKDFGEIMKLIEQGKYSKEKEEAFCKRNIENLENVTKKLAEFILSQCNK